MTQVRHVRLLKMRKCIIRPYYFRSLHSTPRPQNLHDLLPAGRALQHDPRAERQLLVGSDRQLTPLQQALQLTALRNVVGAGAEKIVWVGTIPPHNPHFFQK